MTEHKLPPEAHEMVRQSLDNGLAIVAIPGDGVLHLGFVDSEALDGVVEAATDEGDSEHMSFVVSITNPKLGTEGDATGLIKCLTSTWGMVQDAFTEVEGEEGYPAAETVVGRQDD